MPHLPRRTRHLRLLTCLSISAALIGCSRSPAPPASPPRESPSPTAAPPSSVEYQHLTNPGPVSVHVVSFDLADPDLSLHATVGSGVYGSQTLTEMIGQFPPELGRPIAMVNGDYFEFRTEPRYFGTLQGMCLIDGELVAAPAATTFWIDAARQPHLGAVSAQFSLTLPDGSTVPFGLNCSTSDYRSEVRSAGVVLFTPAFGPSTNTEPAREYVLDPVGPADRLPLRPNTSIQMSVLAGSVHGDTAIEPGTVVLSIARNADDQFPALMPGDHVTITTTLTPDLTGAITAMSGDPLVLTGGNVIEGRGNSGRHPRTSVGIAGTRCFLAVADGRQPGHSVGLSYQELGELMLSLGCTDALNLDGGGSSAFWYDGQIRNRPSDGHERPVGAALVIVHHPSASN